ncbi:MAG TPA: (Fe-S)-binding protein [Streptosporangiaceae bacterium]|nr:(Fe-S)-binding protein [Streptosporangiaceae bacterium]
MLVRFVLGAVIMLGGLALAGRRLAWLGRLVRSGAPAPGRVSNVPSRLAAQLVEVIGQRKLLKRWRSGVPHALVFWGFLILLFTVAEALGDTFVSKTFAIPLIGHAAVLGFIEDLFTVIVLAGLAVFTGIRLADSPARRGKKSRFYGSHTGAAWITLGMIATVMITLLGYRAAQVNTGDFPYGRAAFASHGLAAVMRPLGTSANAGLETFFLLANVAVIMGFLVFVTYSKHLHIFLAPLNVTFSRRPRALGALGELPSAPTAAGAGKIGELSWKQLLDTLTCTECGRCQSVCPAWNSGKPLSPKLLIMDLRDHLMASAGGQDAAKPLVPDVIGQDVIWSCTTCGACVEQCPVDIEHVDTIVTLRRRLVEEGRMEPSVQQVLQGDAQQGNTFGKSGRMRARWTRDVGFTVKDARKEPVRYLWFVGDFASFDDRLQALSRRLAGILHDAGVDFGLLFEDEHDDGNDVRRVGEEGLFQMLAEHNMNSFAKASFDEIFTTDPHAFNTLRNEYPSFGLDKPVSHYSQLLDKLLGDGAIAVAPLGLKVTYHDPCYLARHNRLTDPPRRVLRSLGCDLIEMPRHGLNTFCCGAGGGRIWMTDSVPVGPPAGGGSGNGAARHGASGDGAADQGTATGSPPGTERPSENRIREAVALGVSYFVVSCPKDYVMYTDAAKTTGNADRIEVVDLVELVERARALAVPVFEEV